MMDSDGNTEPILDLVIGAGITGHWPLEVNSGMDYDFSENGTGTSSCYRATWRREK